MKSTEKRHFSQALENRKSLLFVGVLCSLLLTLLIASCKPDPCNDIWCLNNGTCVDGTCLCEGGFSGERCEIQDLCYEVDCQNGGTCVEGTCDCPDAWEGARCETLAREKFLGTYNITQTCDGDTTLYTCLITAGGNVLTEIQFDNFHNMVTDFGISDIAIGQVSGAGIFISPQTFSNGGNSLSISGGGAWSETSININYTATLNGGTPSACRMVFSQ